MTSSQGGSGDLPSMATVVRQRRIGRIVEGSCWSCRRRRVKCDLLKPTCTRCQSNGQHCDYGPVAPIKWVGGVALRGRNAPAHPPEEHHEAPKAQTSNMSLVAPPSALSLDPEGLVLYFANAVLPRFQLMSESLNVDLNAIMQDEPVQQAILAVAQSHHDTHLHTTSNNSLVCRRRARHSAIQILRQQLELGLNSASSAQQILTVMVLLCMLDGMIEPFEQTNASTFHLKGGYALIQKFSNTPANMLTHGGLQAHLFSVFATMDLVHALLSGDKPYFDPFIWYMFSDIQAWFGRLDGDDRFLALLKTFSEMASLGHLVASQLPSDDGVRLVEKCLPPIELALSPDSRGPLKPVSNSPIPPEDWHTFCALYDLSGTIYLLRALRKLPIDDEQVQAVTQEGIRKIVDEALPGMMAHCIIFPILVIGAHALTEVDREPILQAISPTMDYLSFRNLQVMTDLLKDIWSKSDMQASWWDCFQSVAGNVFLF